MTKLSLLLILKVKTFPLNFGCENNFETRLLSIERPGSPKTALCPVQVQVQRVCQQLLSWSLLEGWAATCKLPVLWSELNNVLAGEELGTRCPTLSMLPALTRWGSILCTDYIETTAGGWWVGSYWGGLVSPVYSRYVIRQQIWYFPHPGAGSQQPVSRTTDLDTVNVKAADTVLSFHGTSGDRAHGAPGPVSNIIIQY